MLFAQFLLTHGKSCLPKCHQEVPQTAESAKAPSEGIMLRHGGDQLEPSIAPDFAIVSIAKQLHYPKRPEQKFALL